MPKPPPPTLNVRQYDALRMMAEGKSRKLIAHELQLSRGSVNEYLDQVYCTLGAKTAPQAVYLAMKKGILK